MENRCTHLGVCVGGHCCVVVVVVVRRRLFGGERKAVVLAVATLTRILNGARMNNRETATSNSRTICIDGANGRNIEWDDL